jgi:two-component system chemotaxis sensor kinase CheA
MGKFRDGMAVTGEAVSLIIAAIDRIKIILDGLEKLQHEPPGDDADLIGQLNRAAACAQASNPARQDDGPAAGERSSDEVAHESGDGPLRATSLNRAKELAVLRVSRSG